MALEGRQSPANQSVYADAKVAADPVLKSFHDQVEVAVPMPDLPEMNMVGAPATTVMNSVTPHAASPKAALDAAQAAISQDVEGAREKSCPLGPPSGCSCCMTM